MSQGRNKSPNKRESQSRSSSSSRREREKESRHRGDWVWFCRVWLGLEDVEESFLGEEEEEAERGDEK